MRKYHVQVLMNGRWQNTYFTPQWPAVQDKKWRGALGEAYSALWTARFEFPNERYRMKSVKR